MRFEKVAEIVFSYYGQEKYSEALEVVKKAMKEYPEKEHRTAYWAACLYAKSNDYKSAINVLRECFHKGFWWAPAMLTKDPDLAPLYDNDEFKQLVSECNIVYKKVQAETKPELLIKIPKNYYENKHYPLMVVLHWRGGNVKDFSKHWNIPVLRDNYILAFPQSSQVLGMESYCWDNIEIAKQEILTHYNNIINEYKIDINQIIIAGASQGGRLSIDLALEENIFHGFIAAIPALSDIDYYIKLKDNWKYEKGVIIAGDKDYYYQKTKQFYSIFKELNYPIKLIVEKELGHTLSENFSNHIKKSIEFINET